MMSAVKGSPYASICSAIPSNGLFIDVNATMWDNPTMSTSTVDSKKRIVLPHGRPGEVFDIQQQNDGRLILVRLEKPEVPAPMSREACLEAMCDAPLRPIMPWESLRELTREP